MSNLPDRYDTTGNPEGQYQPGSGERILLNKLGITNPLEMDELELDLLYQLTDAVIEDVSEKEVISVDHLCGWHRCWLGNVYSWAGRYRSVNIGKGGFQFAAAHLVPKLMQDFEKQFLSIYYICP